MVGAGSGRDQRTVGDIGLDDLPGQIRHAYLVAAVAGPDGRPAPVPALILEQVVQRRGVVGDVPAVLAIRAAIGAERTALDGDQVRDRMLIRFQLAAESANRLSRHVGHLEADAVRQHPGDGPDRLGAGRVRDYGDRHAHLAERGREVAHAVEPVGLGRRRLSVADEEAAYDADVRPRMLGDGPGRGLKVALGECHHAADVTPGRAAHDVLHSRDLTHDHLNVYLTYILVSVTPLQSGVHRRARKSLLVDDGIRYVYVGYMPIDLMCTLAIRGPLESTVLPSLDTQAK